MAGSAPAGGPAGVEHGAWGSLLDAVAATPQLSLLQEVLQSGRPGTKAALLRRRLGGAAAQGSQSPGAGLPAEGVPLTFLAPTNSAFKKLARERHTTEELLCKAADIGDLLMGHVFEGRWPVAALRMGKILDTMRRDVQLAFGKDSAGRVCVAPAGCSAPRQPFAIPVDFACSNGVLHALGSILVAVQGWDTNVRVSRESRPEPGPRGARAAKAKARGSKSLPGRPAAARPWTPAAYAGVAPAPPRRQSDLRRASPPTTWRPGVHRVPWQQQDDHRKEAEEDVWYESNQLALEARQLDAELQGWKRRLRSTEELIRQHEELALTALPRAGVTLDARPAAAPLGLVAGSREELRRLKEVISQELVVLKDVSIGARTIPAGSTLLQEHSMKEGRNGVERGLSWQHIASLALPARLSFRAPRALPGSFAVAPAGLPPAPEAPVGDEETLEATLLAAQVKKGLTGCTAPALEELEAKCSALVRRLLPPGAAALGQPARLGDALQAAARSCGGSWSSEDVLCLARVCDACGALPPEAEGRRPARARHEEEAPPGGDPAVAEEEPEHPLLDRPITGPELADALDRLGLPESHGRLQEAMLGMRQLCRQLRGTGASELQALAREVEAGAIQLQERQGRLDVMEARLPAAWTLPSHLWESLFPEGCRPPPRDAPAPEWRKAACAALLEAKLEAGRRADEQRVEEEQQRMEVDRVMRDRVLAEAEADALEAENRMLEAEIRQQSRRRSELIAGRRRGDSAARATAEAMADQFRYRREERLEQRRVTLIQRLWRQRQQARAQGPG